MIFFSVKALAVVLISRLIEPIFMCLYPYVTHYPSFTATSFVANHMPYLLSSVDRCLHLVIPFLMVFRLHNLHIVKTWK